ncbi:hypothetical protein O181_081972, partial [Austropuccinia psidii MF-1]|nr:hypothetical protein [Austropuccinia psidii MF-1]
EENYIPLETQSQANTPVTPSEPEVSKGKGKRHSEGLITAKKWTPIATQRNIKPQNSPSIQGKPTLTTCTWKITIINPVVTSKGKFPESADNKFVQGTVKETLASKGTNQRIENAFPEPEDLEEETLAPVVDGKTLREIIPTLPITFQFNRNLKPEDWKDMDQALQLYQLLKVVFQWSKEKKRFNLASHWEDLGESFQKICLEEIDFKDLMVTPKVQIPPGSSDSWRLTRSRPNQLSSGFTQFRNQQISGQELKFFTISGSFQEKKRIQGQKQDHLQPEEERVRHNDTEAFRFGERSALKPKVVVNNSRISGPIHRNITPTPIEHNFVTPESNLNSDALWLQMSQYVEQAEKQLAELEASHERMKILTASMDKIIKNLQEGHAQLSKASE